MMDALRRGAGTWVAKIFLMLLVLSFAVWGIADIFTGYRGDALVTIGKTEVSGERYRYELQTEMQNFGRTIGRPLTLQEARAFGIDAQVLGRLITEASLDEKARIMGLNVSDAGIARAISQDPQFQTPSGQFDRSYFQQVLRASGRSEAGYVAEKRREMLRQAIANGLTAGSVPSQTLLDAVHEYANEKRTMDYFVITADDLEPVGEPDEEAISAYFEENKQTFAAPEYRKLAVLAVDPQALAETIEITEDDARAEYEARIDRYQTPERREVRQIVFADEEEARAARAAIDAGKSFDDIAAERGLGPDETRLGLVRQDEIVDPVVGKAAFALEQGAVSDVIEGQFGFVLASVTSIEPGSERSFEEAREEILAALKLQRAENEVLDLFDEIEDARAGGQTLAEIATAKRLELLTIEAIDASGNGPDGAAIADLPGGSELVREAFASDVGLENDPIQQRGTTFIWYEVNEIEPARERTLDEVRDRVVAAWKQQQRDEALNAMASEAVDRINAGTPITTVAGEHGKSVTSVRGVTRTQTSGPAGQAAVSRLFTLAKGAAAHTATQEGPNRIVFVMTGSSVPEPARDSEETERLADQLSLAMSNDLLTGYVTGLESEFDMSVNEKLLRELLGEPAN